MAFRRPSFAVFGDDGAFVKAEKDQQERDLMRLCLPAGHDDFGLDAPSSAGRCASSAQTAP